MITELTELPQPKLRFNKTTKLFDVPERNWFDQDAKDLAMKLFSEAGLGFFKKDTNAFVPISNSAFELSHNHKTKRFNCFGYKNKSLYKAIELFLQHTTEYELRKTDQKDPVIVLSEGYKKQTETIISHAQDHNVFLNQGQQEWIELKESIRVLKKERDALQERVKAITVYQETIVSLATELFQEKRKNERLEAFFEAEGEGLTKTVREELKRLWRNL